MAEKKTTEAAAPATPEQQAKCPEEFAEIGRLRVEHKVPQAIFAGVCAAQGWKPGKAVARAEFLAAVEAFKQAPMGSPASKGVKK